MARSDVSDLEWEFIKAALPNKIRGKGRRLSHTMDARRGEPLLTSPAPVTAVALTCAEADAWATALMVLGVDAGARFAEKHGLDVLFLLREDNDVVRSVGVGRLFVTKQKVITSVAGS